MCRHWKYVSLSRRLVSRWQWSVSRPTSSTTSSSLASWWRRCHSCLTCCRASLERRSVWASRRCSLTQSCCSSCRILPRAPSTQRRSSVSVGRERVGVGEVRLLHSWDNITILLVAVQKVSFCKQQLNCLKLLQIINRLSERIRANWVNSEFHPLTKPNCEATCSEL